MKLIALTVYIKNNEKVPGSIPGKTIFYLSLFSLKLEK